MKKIEDLEIFRNKPVDNAVYFVTDPTLHEDIKLMSDFLLELEKEYPGVKFYVLDAKTKTDQEVRNITKMLPTLFIFNKDKGEGGEVSTYTGTYSQTELAKILNKIFGTNISLTN